MEKTEVINGIHIPLRELSSERVLAEVARVADYPFYQENATRIQSIVRTTDGAQNEVDVILEFVSVQK